jgi:hypothetical protein
VRYVIYALIALGLYVSFESSDEIKDTPTHQKLLVSVMWPGFASALIFTHLMSDNQTLSSPPDQ